MPANPLVSVEPDAEFDDEDAAFPVDTGVEDIATFIFSHLLSIVI
jgi:hypothetical protein